MLLLFEVIDLLFVPLHVYYSEGENEVWYYSTKGQITELIEVFDKHGFEREIAFVLSDLRDDITRQMAITESLTKEKCISNKKSAIEVETGECFCLYHHIYYTLRN